MRKSAQDGEFAHAAEAIRQAMQDNPDLANLSHQVIIEQTPQGLRIQLVDQDGRPMFQQGTDRADALYQEAAGRGGRHHRPPCPTASRSAAIPAATMRRRRQQLGTVVRPRQPARALLQAGGLASDRIYEVAGKAGSEPLLPEDPNASRQPPAFHRAAARSAAGAAGQYRAELTLSAQKSVGRRIFGFSRAAARAILGSRVELGIRAVTDQRNTRVPQFFLTPGGPCPYLPGRIERKVFARLAGNLAQPLTEALTHSGFRRSQSIAYRPACEGCTPASRCASWPASSSPAAARSASSGATPIWSAREVAAEATREQFALLRTYLDSRHSGGGMSDMGLFDYVAMVEETPVDTHIVEYRDDATARCWPAPSPIGCATGCRWSIRFFHPGEEARSLGTYMILDHVRAARARGLPYVYLGYWVRGSDKMDYKVRFRRWKRWARMAGKR